MFAMLDRLYNDNREEINEVPVEAPRNAVDKTTEIKNYKRLYYLHNLEIYRERNRLYRLRKKNEAVINVNENNNI